MRQPGTIPYSWNWQGLNNALMMLEQRTQNLEGGREYRDTVYSDDQDNGIQ